MTRIEIARGNGITLVSIGNGATYELGQNGGSVVFVQDDDATQLREEWEAIEAANPELHTGGCLLKLLEIYA